MWQNIHWNQWPHRVSGTQAMRPQQRQNLTMYVNVHSSGNIVAVYKLDTCDLEWATWRELCIFCSVHVRVQSLLPHIAYYTLQYWWNVAAWNQPLQSSKSSVHVSDDGCWCPQWRRHLGSWFSFDWDVVIGLWWGQGICCPGIVPMWPGMSLHGWCTIDGLGKARSRTRRPPV